MMRIRTTVDGDAVEGVYQGTIDASIRDVLVWTLNNAAWANGVIGDVALYTISGGHIATISTNNALNAYAGERN
jgi:hypothetical protein